MACETGSSCTETIRRYRSILAPQLDPVLEAKNLVRDPSKIFHDNWLYAHLYVRLGAVVHEALLSRAAPDSHTLSVFDSFLNYRKTTQREVKYDDFAQAWHMLSDNQADLSLRKELFRALFLCPDHLLDHWTGEFECWLSGLQ